MVWAMCSHSYTQYINRYRSWAFPIYIGQALRWYMVRATILNAYMVCFTSMLPKDWFSKGETLIACCIAVHLGISGLASLCSPLVARVHITLKIKAKISKISIGRCGLLRYLGAKKYRIFAPKILNVK